MDFEMADPVAQFLAPADEPQEQIVQAPVEPAPAPEPVSAPVVEEKAEEPVVVEEPAVVEKAEPTPKPAPAPIPAEEVKPKAPTPKPKAAPKPKVEGEGYAKRERKTVEHFQVAKPKEEEPMMMDGKGTKLRDIPNVAFKMSKISGRDELMESLHNIIYRRKGAATTRKKAILDFNGFAFPAENEEKEIEARKVSLGKWKLDLINKLMDALDIPRGSGDKGTKIDRVVEFLEKPEQKSEVDLAAKEAAKKEKEKRKRERAAAEKAKAKKRKATAPASKKKATKEEASGSESEAEAEESEEEEASESEEEVQPTKKKAKTTPATASKKEKKATPKKATPSKKAATPAEEEQPVMKLSLDTIKTDVEGLLSKMSDEELGMLTVKTLLAKMQEKYGFEVRPRKSEFKAAMHAYAEVRLPQEPAAEEAA